MMDNFRIGVREYLNKHAKRQDLIPGAMDVLEHFFVSAETGEYRLLDAERLMQGNVSVILAEVYGDRMARKILPVSISDPFPYIEWLTDPAYEVLRNDFLCAGLERSLGKRLSHHLDRLMDLFPEVQRAHCLNRLCYSLVTTLGQGLTSSFHSLLHESCLVSIYYFVQSVVSGNEDAIRHFTPLMRLLKDVLPLGEKDDEPGAMIVLVA